MSRTIRSLRRLGAGRPWARRRIPALGLALALVVGSGTGLAVSALSGTPAGADTTLGGFTVSALAEGITAQYEQPNLPIPANPSLEFDEGYSATSDNFGPSGSAVASTLYPGQVIANIGPELSLLVPGVPLPPAPVWPAQAVSGYPEAPNTASTDEPGLNMDTTSTADANQATATIGDDAPTAGALGTLLGGLAPSGSGNPLAASSSLIGVGLISGTSTSGASGPTASASASATDSGISVLDGFINIGAVTSTATATSDGSTGKVTGSTVVSNVTIAGEAVTIDANGISLVGKAKVLSLPIAALNTLLKELGISISVTNPTDAVSGASAARTLDGLKIEVNLDTLDTAANKFASLLPATLTSKLPVPIPNMQLLTLDLGTVTVNSTASGAFTGDDSGGTGTDTTGDTGGGFTPSTDGSTGDFGSTPGSTFTPTGTTGSSTPTSTPGGSASNQPTSAITPVFKGIGTGLVLLLVLASLALAYGYKRVEDASELVGSGCVDGDPINDLFRDTGEPFGDAGGFGA
ncbi:MAG TPA: hypothetical protein VGL48_08995 [Acidimicrobiales bacterium]|jgi:hypothetical protein